MYNPFFKGLKGKLYQAPYSGRNLSGSFGQRNVDRQARSAITNYVRVPRSHASFKSA